MPSITPAESWAPASDVVTLPSGRTARMRASFPIYSLLRSGRISTEELAAFESARSGDLKDMDVAVRLVDVICEVMFLEPRVSVPGEDGSVPAGHVSIEALEQEDQDFALDRAFGGTPSDTFPGEQPGDEHGKNGEVLGDDAKPPARRAKRKPASARSRQRAS